MASSKKKQSKKQTRATLAPKRAATKTSRKTSPKPAKKAAPPKKVAAKTKGTVRKPSHAAPPTFAEKVRRCEAGTGIWFIVAGSVEHATIQKRGSDGSVVIRTDAGATEVVPVGNLFETADEARAARYR